MPKMELIFSLATKTRHKKSAKKNIVTSSMVALHDGVDVDNDGGIG